MNKIRVFLTLTGYQLTWLSCVFGEKTFDNDLLGVYVGTVFLLIYFYFNKNKLHYLKIFFLIFIPGYFFDTLMVYFSVYKFNTTIIIGTLPAWMIILWFSFSTLFDEILTIFKHYKIIGLVLSGILGPLTYYLGQPIGILTISNLPIFFTMMIIFWIILMGYYLIIVLNET